MYTEIVETYEESSGLALPNPGVLLWGSVITVKHAVVYKSSRKATRIPLEDTVGIEMFSESRDVEKRKF
jgi:hypothetical protein